MTAQGTSSLPATDGDGTRPLPAAPRRPFFPVHDPSAGDVSRRAFARLEAATGAHSLLPISLGLLMVAIFGAAAALIFAAIQQGADLQQLLIAGIVVVVANLLVALSWMAVKAKQG